MYQLRGSTEVPDGMCDSSLESFITKMMEKKPLLLPSVSRSHANVICTRSISVPSKVIRFARFILPRSWQIIFISVMESCSCWMPVLVCCVNHNIHTNDERSSLVYGSANWNKYYSSLNYVCRILFVR